MGMFIAANILGSSIQISTLPLPVLSTLQASGLVFNSICATLILGEPFTRWSLWGTLLVCTGAVLIAVFGAIPSPAHDLDELLALLGRGPFVGWMIFQGLLVVAIAVVTELGNTLSKYAHAARFRLARGLAFGCISGILSAHSLLVAKSAVELIIKTLVDGKNQFIHWQSWMLVATLVVLALTQLYYLHRGLKLVSTSVLYPLVFCVYNIIAILDGLIYFDQTNLISTLQAWLITLGTVILLSGVLALSWRLHDEQHQPAVGQSSLAPGLGFVEDTEGEEEEELLLDSDTYDEDNVLPSYQTFTPRTPDTPLTPTRKKSFRWHEHEEIWGELEDHHNDRTSVINKRRSNTMPISEATSLLTPSSRRVFSGEVRSLNDEPGPSTEGAQPPPLPPLQSRRTTFRKRRKSTGFPGFTARRTRRKSGGTLQDAIGGIWKLRWWNPSKGKGADSVPFPAFPDEEQGQGPGPEPSADGNDLADERPPV
jgi:magnesium transporter